MQRKLTYSSLSNLIMPRQNQNVLRAGRRRKRSCSPGLPSTAPTAKPKPKDPHENDIQFTERYKNRHTHDDLVEVLEGLFQLVLLVGINPIAAALEEHVVVGDI